YALGLLIRTGNSSMEALLRVFNEYRFLASFRVVQAIVRTVLLVAVVALDWGIDGILWAEVAAIVFWVIWLSAKSVSVIRKHLEPRALLAWGSVADQRGPLVRFAAISNLNGSVLLLSRGVDTLVLGIFGSEAAVGAYRLARLLIDQAAQLVAPIVEVIYPEVAKRVTTVEGRKTFKKRAKRLSALLFAISAVGGIAATLLAGIGIRVYAGPGFELAADCFRLMTWGLVIYAPLSWIPGFLQATDRQPWLLVQTVLSLLTLISVTYALAADWGPLAPSLGYLSCWVVWLVIGLPMVRAIMRQPEWNG
ncbi:MAG: oligosaccharide flippase family protein, partial [Myxococcales bacterium]|nr:oligosaccharide flippase family protein [Myxococcales bacterium]